MIGIYYYHKSISLPWYEMLAWMCSGLYIPESVIYLYSMLKVHLFPLSCLFVPCHPGPALFDSQTGTCEGRGTVAFSFKRHFFRHVHIQVFTVQASQSGPMFKHNDFFHPFVKFLKQVMLWHIWLLYFCFARFIL